MNFPYIQRSSNTWFCTVVAAVALLQLPSTEHRVEAEGLQPPVCPSASDGQYCVTGDAIVFPGEYVYESTPQCDKDLVGLFDTIVAGYENSTLADVTTYAGPLTAGTPVLLNGSDRKLMADVSEALSAHRIANCALIAVAIPKDTIFIRAVVEAREARDSEWHACSFNQDCSIGWSKFDQPVTRKTSFGGLIIGTTFRNWSHNRPRSARLVVYFSPAAGSDPTNFPPSPAPMYPGDTVEYSAKGKNADIVALTDNETGSAIGTDLILNERLRDYAKATDNTALIVRQGVNSGGDCASLYGIVWRLDTSTGKGQGSFDQVLMFHPADGTLIVKSIITTERGVIFNLQTGKRAPYWYTSFLYNRAENKWLYWPTRGGGFNTSNTPQPVASKYNGNDYTPYLRSPIPRDD